MSKVVSSDGRYTYCRNSRSGDHQEIDIHEIISRRSNGKMIILCVSCLLLILCFYGSAVLLYQESRHVSVVGVLVISISVLVSSQLRTVQKECVVIIPSLGVQLETYYWSGRIQRRLVSLGKILRPVLNEIVTPVRCYWSLAFMLDGNEDLMLVFQGLRPPVKMLAPIWKALCDATGREVEEPATEDVG